MTAQLRIRDFAGATMAIFGALAVALGALGILSPETQLQLLNFEVLPRPQRLSGDYSLVFLTASSMASFNMGVYYLLAALTGWRAFYRWTVPFRCLTFIVFTAAVISGTAPQGFLGVALWELLGAVATAGALLIDRRRSAA